MASVAPMTMVVFRALAVQLGDFNSQEVANIPWAFDSQTIASRKSQQTVFQNDFFYNRFFQNRFSPRSAMPRPIGEKRFFQSFSQHRLFQNRFLSNLGFPQTDFFPKKSGNIDQTFANNLPKSADIGQQSTRNLPKSTKIGNQTIKISQNSAKVNWPGWASGVID